MNAVLLCSEIPKGMKSYGPKAIVPIGKLKIPLIIKQIRCLQKLCNKIYIVVGFDKQKIIDIIDYYNITNIEYIDHYDYINSNDGGAVSRLIRHIDLGEDCLIIQSGVVVTNIPHSEDNTIYYIKNQKYIQDLNGFNIGIRTDDNDKASYLFYDTTIQTWVEIVYLKSYALNHLKKMVLDNKIYDSMFLFECVNLIIDSGINIEAVPLNKHCVNKIYHHKQII